MNYTCWTTVSGWCSSNLSWFF